MSQPAQIPCLRNPGEPPHSLDTLEPLDLSLGTSNLQNNTATLDVPSQPSMSGSRSLTTLIRDLHAEFPELDDMKSSWTISLTSEVLDDTPLDLISAGSSDSLPSISSLLDELELISSTVMVLPVPRPPSLSPADWERALDSPDPTQSSHIAWKDDEGHERPHSVEPVLTDTKVRLSSSKISVKALIVR